ncbi:MAG: hypothetical protein DYG94_11550 [Leptolyngbya sp. PLA3]|nr:MAG: hypothetical protein EDM82_11690 [Cyanobacteria bacterium CYA]MCE7969360.1 hypothetical protein [Leptolyngbya sp. PL-A3]
MARKRFHPAVAWLCLIWFGLTNTLLASGMVVCRDGHGGSRIEWGCAQNASGECATSCGSDADEPGGDTGPAHPCDDTPINGDHEVTMTPPRTTNDLPVPIPVMLAVITLHIDVPSTQVLWDRARSQRPPDSLQRLRSVILLV